MSRLDGVLVPAIVNCEIEKARLAFRRPTPAEEMEAIAKAILALRYSKSAAVREAYRDVLRKELRRK